MEGDDKEAAVAGSLPGACKVAGRDPGVQNAGRPTVLDVSMEPRRSVWMCGSERKGRGEASTAKQCGGAGRTSCCIAHEPKGGVAACCLMPSHTRAAPQSAHLQPRGEVPSALCPQQPLQGSRQRMAAAAAARGRREAEATRPGCVKTPL